MKHPKRPEFFLTDYSGISKSKKQAQEIISTGKIENLKEVDRILKVLNAGQDLESKHLWGQLNELKEKHTKAS